MESRPHHRFGRPARVRQTPGATAESWVPVQTRPEVPVSTLKPASAAAATIIPTSVPLNFVLIMTAILIITHFGRPFDQVQVVGRIPGIICGLGILFMTFSGAFIHMRSSIGRAVGAYSAWMLVCAPFSTWRGGSVEYVIWFVAFWVVLMLVVGHGARSVRDIVILAGVTSFSCLFYLLVGNRVFAERLAGTGKWGNSDDIALLAGFAIPFTILIGVRIKNSILRFGFIAAGVGYLLVTTGRTATRAAIPAMVGMVAIYFWRSTAANRLTIVVGSIIALFGLLFVLPQSTLDRFATIKDSFNSSSAPSSEAMASTAERRELMKDALLLVRDNPVFGVGPGEFADYRYRYLRQPNRMRKLYSPSHNTFLQIGAESGIPGMLLYVTFLFFTYRTVLRIRTMAAQSHHPDAALFSKVAMCLEAALVYFAICALFMTCDWHPHQFVIAGLAIASERVIKYWIAGQSSSRSTQGLPGISTQFQLPVHVGR